MYVVLNQFFAIYSSATAMNINLGVYNMEVVFLSLKKNRTEQNRINISLNTPKIKHK